MNTATQPFAMETIPLSGKNAILAGAGTGKTYALIEIIRRLRCEKQIPLHRILAVTFSDAATTELKWRISDAMPVSENEKDFPPIQVFTIHSFCLKGLLQFAPTIGLSSQLEVIDEAGEKEFRRSLIIQALNQYLKSTSPLFHQFFLNRRQLWRELIYFTDIASRAVDLRVLEGTPEDGGAQVEENFNAGFSQLKIHWNQFRTAIEKVFLHHRLNQRLFPLRKALIWLRKMDSVLSEDDPRLFFLPLLEKFTTEKAQKALTKNSPKGADYEQIFGPFTLLHQLQTALEAQFTRSWRNFCSEFLSSFRERHIAQKLHAEKIYFDDMIILFSRALDNDQFKESIRASYDAFLIDEFQDTDSLQTRIFSDLFASTHPCYFIGDAKQSIYSFRGAQVINYHHFMDQVDAKFTLTHNYRSTPHLVSAINGLFTHKTHPFVFPHFRYETLKPVGLKHHREPGAAPAVTLSFLQPKEGEKKLTKGEARKRVIGRITHEIVHLINTQQLDLADLGQIAIIVRKNSECQMVFAALSQHHILCTLAVDEALWRSREAISCLTLCQKLLALSEKASLPTLAATFFFNWSPQDISELAENPSAEFFAYLKQLLTTWQESGVSALWLQIKQKNAFTRGSRKRFWQAADCLENIFLLLSQKETKENMTCAELTNWLSKNVLHGTGSESSFDQVAGAGVRIMTAHKSKGLEFPMVFCAFVGWEDIQNRESFCQFTEKKTGNSALDLGSAQFNQNRQQSELESLSEEIRLLYVALTRAKKRCWFYWGKIEDTFASAMAYTLHRKEVDAEPFSLAEHLETMKKLTEKDMLGDIERIAHLTQGSIHFEPIMEDENLVPQINESPLPLPLEFQPLTPRYFFKWGAESFTSLAKSSSKSELRIQLFEDAKNVPPYLESFADRVETSMDPINSILDFPKGKVSGLFFHRLLQKFHSNNPYERADGLDLLISKTLSEFSFPVSLLGVVKNFMTKLANGYLWTRTQEPIPWNAVFGESSLREMEFNLPAHKLRHKDVLTIYERHQRSTEVKELTKLNPFEFSGFVAGFMDMIFTHEEQFYIIDWKSNHLGMALDDYSQPALTDVVLDKKYFFQSDLYALAFSKYLKQSHPYFRYDQHFGGTINVFLRAIDCPDADAGAGIYFHRPTLQFMKDMEDLIWG